MILMKRYYKEEECFEKRCGCKYDYIKDEEDEDRYFGFVGKDKICEKCGLFPWREINV